MQFFSFFMKIISIGKDFLALVFMKNNYYMNKSQRIYLSTGTTGNNGNDKSIIVKLEQDVETLEFLTMSISTEDAYQNFNADYGVLIGRVLANGSIGVPNAKISIFIPLTVADAHRPAIYSHLSLYYSQRFK